MENQTDASVENPQPFTDILQSMLDSIPMGIFGMRTDVLALVAFYKDTSVYDTMKLFWSSIEPEIFMQREEAPALPEDKEKMILDCLGLPEERHRVPYQPDQDDFENPFELLQYIHLAAARAIRLKRIQGISDDVRTCFENVMRAMERLGPIAGGPAAWISAGAITGMVLTELSRIASLDGQYGEAIHLLAEATQYYDGSVANNVEQTVEQAVELWGGKFAGDELFWQGQLEHYLTGLDLPLDEAAATFSQLQVQARNAEWKQVADDCRILQTCGT